MTPQEKRSELDARVKAIIDAQGFDAEKDAFTIEQIEAAKKARVKMNTMIAGKPASVYYIDRMVDGEKALKEERYFDAEDAFSRALGASPLDAMAQAGRVHAQIGAGLYMSAAANLRDLYTTHPEMIGVKYDTTVMPPAERMKIIREQLAKATNSESALAGDAGLLRAYLAYQAGDLEGVDKGLRTFGAKIPPESAADLALLELSAKVWKAPLPADLPVLERAPDELPKPAGDAGNTNK
jgi:predicted Zn-dependent protease